MSVSAAGEGLRARALCWLQLLQTLVFKLDGEFLRHQSELHKKYDTYNMLYWHRSDLTVS